MPIPREEEERRQEILWGAMGDYQAKMRQLGIDPNSPEGRAHARQMLSRLGAAAHAGDVPVEAAGRIEAARDPFASRVKYTRDPSLRRAQIRLATRAAMERGVDPAEASKLGQQASLRPRELDVVLGEGAGFTPEPEPRRGPRTTVYPPVRQTAETAFPPAQIRPRVEPTERLAWLNDENALLGALSTVTGALQMQKGKGKGKFVPFTSMPGDFQAAFMEETGLQEMPAGWYLKDLSKRGRQLVSSLALKGVGPRKKTAPRTFAASGTEEEGPIRL